MLTQEQIWATVIFCTLTVLFLVPKTGCELFKLLTVLFVMYSHSQLSDLGGISLLLPASALIAYIHREPKMPWNIFLGLSQSSVHCLFQGRPSVPQGGSLNSLIPDLSPYTLKVGGKTMEQTCSLVRVPRDSSSSCQPSRSH